MPNSVSTSTALLIVDQSLADPITTATSGVLTPPSLPDSAAFTLKPGQRELDEGAGALAVNYGGVGSSWG